MARDRKRGGYGFAVNLTGPGSIFTLGIIAIAIGFGILLSKGVTPSTVLSDPGETGDIEIIQETPDPAQKGLQLKTLKFKECAATTAVSLQIDITGSMAPYIADLRNAVLSFTDPLSDDSILGIQAYNSVYPRLEVIPIDVYKNIKDQVRPKVLSLYPGGSTPSYDAIMFSSELLTEAKKKFPDRKFNYIFFSDGNPNVGPATPADIATAAQTIKDQDVTVYAIGLGDVNPQVINAVASSPDKAVVVANSKQLADVYKSIAQRICNTEATPTPAQ